MLFEDKKLSKRLNDFKTCIFPYFIPSKDNFSNEIYKREIFATKLRKNHNELIFSSKRAKAVENTINIISPDIVFSL